jgi:tetratricopeptide (TPR) repeat protein
MRISLRRAAWALLAPALFLPAGASAFRYVAVGSPAPALAVEQLEGAPVTIPAAGRLTVLVFWRPGQQLSEEALTTLGGLAPSLRVRNVEVVAVMESGGDAAQSQDRAGRLPLRFVLDRNGRLAEAYGVIVFPSTAVIGADGRLRHYVPSRTADYGALIEAHVLHAGGQMSDAEHARRAGRLGEPPAAGGDPVHGALARGAALARQGRYAEARPFLLEAVTRAPEHPGAQLELAHVELELGAAADALKRFELVLARSPGLPAARLGRGIAQLRLGRTDDGIRLIEEAVLMNPEPVRGHLELARAYEGKGELARALEHYRWAYQKLLQGRK